MALRLRIVSEHRRALGQRSSIVFGVAGGSIGRSADNDWVLPDPARFLSGHHARIHFRHGLFLLEDTSTNGTYLNDSSDPIPKQTPWELHNGDILRLGEYEVVVAIDSSAEHTAERTAGIEVAAQLAEQPDAATAPRLEDNLDISLSPSALFQVEPAASGAAGRQCLRPGGGAALRQSSRARARRTPPAENSDIIAARRMEKLKRTVEAREAQSPVRAQRSRRSAEAPASMPPACQPTRVWPCCSSPGDCCANRSSASRTWKSNSPNCDANSDWVTGALTTRPPRSGSRRPPTTCCRRCCQTMAAAGSTRPNGCARSSSRASGMTPRWLRRCRPPCSRSCRSWSHARSKSVSERSATRNLMGARPSNWELYGEFFRQLVDTQTDAGLPHLFADRLRVAYEGYGKDDREGDDTPS
ncbi:MAG: type VI secretion system-associated FHA domain protein TagH [Steroidobacteraceae bacterium]